MELCIRMRARVCFLRALGYISFVVCVSCSLLVSESLSAEVEEGASAINR